MNDLTALYQEVLLDHYRRPRHAGELVAPTGRAEGHNPLCGDRIVVEVRLGTDRLEEIACRASGCAISVASASLMAEAVNGLDLGEVRELSDRFRDALTRSSERRAGELGKLEALAGVAGFPMRVKCATLPWHALASAMSEGASISTE